MEASSSIDSSSQQDQGILWQQWTEIARLALELGRWLSASLTGQGLGWYLLGGTPALQGSPAQPVPKAGLPLETSDCSPWVLCRAGISTLPFFWAALICGKPGPAYQRTAAYLHTRCVHKIIQCVPLSFAYAVRAPRANLQPQQDWRTGHNMGPENHPSSSSFPLLIF